MEKRVKYCRKNDQSSDNLKYLATPKAAAEVRPFQYFEARIWNFSKTNDRLLFQVKG